MTPSGPSLKTVHRLSQIDASDPIGTDPNYEHACELAASLMLHLVPELVRTDQLKNCLPSGGALRKYTRRRAPAPPLASHCVLGSPSLNPTEKSATVFKGYVDMPYEAIDRPVLNRGGSHG